jgi:hypothetical protein
MIDPTVLDDIADSLRHGPMSARAIVLDTGRDRAEVLAALDQLATAGRAHLLAGGRRWAPGPMQVQRRPIAIQVLESLRANPWQTRQQLSDAFGVRPQTIDVHLWRLRGAGKVRHVGRPLLFALAGEPTPEERAAVPTEADRRVWLYELGALVAVLAGAKVGDDPRDVVARLLWAEAERAS